MIKALNRYIALIACLFLLVSVFCLNASATKQPVIIADFNALMATVRESSDGDIILVGDIDFMPVSPDAPYSMMNIVIDKNITIKSGKSDGYSVFSNGGFLLTGSKAAGKKLEVSFENIVFDGKTDYANLAEKDFEYPWSEAEQTSTFDAPLKAQKVLSFKGSVDVKLSKCVFQNYMHEYGPILEVRYGDYTDNSYMLDLFGDNSTCELNIEFSDCQVLNNTALYDGGAIYIDSNENVKLVANNSIFSMNRSTIGSYSCGGGAIYARGAFLEFNNCKFDNNIANNVFTDSEIPEYDTHKGGAVLLDNGKLCIVNSVFNENRASMGGALSLTNVKADIDGCKFINNKAQAYASNPYNTIGPWSNMEQGGAVYVEGINGDTVSFINCELLNNYAKTAYGSIYGYYTPAEDASFGTYIIKMSLCSIINNTVDTKYDYNSEEIFPWFSHPGDMFANPHLTLFGCYIVDDSFSADFEKDELPKAENAYNYFSSKENNEVLSFIIPSEEANVIVGNRYENKLSEIKVGSNYSENLYNDTTNEESKNSNNALIWIIGSCVVLCIGVIVFLIIKKKKNALAESIIPVTEETAVVDDRKQIVMTRYADAEIDRFLELVPETQLLTGREVEVLREILQGKKQREVAYDLGIEVTTVKDFYKKIYVKLNVDNKDGLFIMASEVLQKNS